jgi:hypothetical protein
MISPGSLSAFSAGSAASPLSRTPTAGSASGVQRVRTQAASPTGTTQQGSPQALPSNPDKKLPRGSLLNLQV